MGNDAVLCVLRLARVLLPAAFVLCGVTASFLGPDPDDGVPPPPRVSDPRDADAWVRLGWTRYRAGDFDRAADAFTRACQAQPDHEDARVGLAYIALQTRPPHEAATLFRAILTSRPDHGDARRGLVLAGQRSGADPALRSEALRAARALAATDPKDEEMGLAVLRLQAAMGAPSERRVRDPSPSGGPLEVTARAGKDLLQIRGVAGAWEPFFVKGVNLGAALPGRFPTEFPPDVPTYAGWLETIAGLGANVVRSYTLLPPAFYRALADHNRDPARRPVRLIQGVWTELPREFNFSRADYVADFEAEIARVVDAIHGNLVLAPRPGHAWGSYSVDVSPWVLALVIGREWEPFAVKAYLAMEPGENDWKGKWLHVRGGHAMERWVAKRCDFAAGYEAARYRALHPVSFASWPTLDPLHHPTESTRAQEDAWKAKWGRPTPATLREAPWEDDAVSIDATRIEPTAAMEAGFFASYHVYPNFPDFLNLEAGYAAARDRHGPSRYAGYLRALKAHHRDQPVLIAEFGISTSRGIAHVQPEGWHHGGHDERAQGDLVARMLRSIHDTRLAGGIVFELLDEWFKGTWSAAPLEVPADRRRLWFNAESPEQSYGLLAIRPASAGIRVDGSGAEWGPVPVLARSVESAPSGGWSALLELRAAADEGWLYLLLRTAGGPVPPDWSRIRFRLALDTYDPVRGERLLPPPGQVAVATGVEFLVEVAAPGTSRIVISAPYEPYARLDAPDGSIASPAIPSGSFVPLWFETNRERFARNGTSHPAVRIERGLLRHGSLDPASDAFDTRADIAVGPAEGLIELRIPWALLNVSDPSSRRVLHQEGARGEALGTVVTEGFRIYALSIDSSHPAGAVLDRLPPAGEIPGLFLWDGWESPRYTVEPKHGLDRIRRTMEHLPSGQGASDGT